MFKRCLGWLLVGLALACPAHAGSLHTALTLSHDDNVGLAPYAGDRRSSSIARLRAAWKASTAAPGIGRLTVSAGGTAESVAQVGGLSSLAGDIELGALWRLGRSFGAPTLGVLIAGGHREFESELRDALWARLRAIAHQQWTTRIAVHGGAYALTHRADDAVFDRERIGIEAGVDWRFGNSRSVFLDADFSSGDATITATPPYSAAAYASRIAADDVFIGQTAYRVDADAMAVTLGLMQRVTPTLALHVKLRRMQLSGDGDTRYDSNAAEIGLRARWR